MKKYELVKIDPKTWHRGTMYRIQALKDFNDVKKGDLGGYVSSLSNLSQTGNSWLYDNSKALDKSYVYDNAILYNDACIYDNAQIHGEAWIGDNAQIADYAEVYGNTQVFGEAYIINKAVIRGGAKVFDKAIIMENALIEDSSIIHGNAVIKGNSTINGLASVHGNAICGGNSIVGECIHLPSGICNEDVCNNKNPKLLLLNSLNVVCNSLNKVILYKKVNKLKEGEYCSIYDDRFRYYLGKTSKVKTYDTSMRACTSGLHASTPTYWKDGDTLIEVEIHIKDIICIQEGKVRCKKLKVISEINI